MGNFLKTKSLTTGFEVLLVVLGLAIAGTCLWFLAPGLRVADSKALDAMKSSAEVNNEVSEDMLELPSKSLTSSELPSFNIAGYAWNGQCAIIAANGGPSTTVGSLMEEKGVKMQIIRQDWLDELRNMQLKFIEEYNSGIDYPTSDKAAMGVIIMGDGVPFYLTSTQKKLNEVYGDKYHLQVVGCMGRSNGEDKFIGPATWKTNPQLMKGKVISTVIGDGDWVTTLNYAFSNGLKVNPDPNTYDKDAVNIVNSEKNDYIKSAEELIKSQTAGYKVELDEVVNGKRTGNKVKCKIDGCATWTPGDKMVFDALSGYTDLASTKDYPNQMATTLIVVKEWAEAHPQVITNLLDATLTAGNQIKQHDQWARKAGDLVAQTFDMENGQYWYSMFKGQSLTKEGTSYSVGGTKAMNYADVMQYYGMTDGKNRYKNTYEQVSTYLRELNPFGFNEEFGAIIPYDQAVNFSYLKSINDIDAGVAETNDYAETKTDVLSNGEFKIQFATGSDKILKSSYAELNQILGIIQQAEQTKLNIIGHTDNTGSIDINYELSEARAQSVQKYFVSKGLNVDRIQLLEGRGPDDPLDTNKTAAGKANNRRVQITLFN